MGWHNVCLCRGVCAVNTGGPNQGRENMITWNVKARLLDGTITTYVIHAESAEAVVAQMRLKRDVAAIGPITLPGCEIFSLLDLAEGRVRLDG